MAKLILGLAVERIGSRLGAKCIYTGPDAEAAIEACRKAIDRGEEEAWLVRDPVPFKRYRQGTPFPALKPATSKKKG